jgi:hypothetical protein
LTPAGAARQRDAFAIWNEAQARFERAFGADRAKALRVLLDNVTASDLSTGAPAPVSA